MPGSILRNLKIPATMFFSYKNLLMDHLRTVLNVLHNELNLFHSYSISHSFFFSVHSFIYLPVPHFLSSTPFICLILPRRKSYLVTLRLYGRYVLLLQQSKISTDATGMILVLLLQRYFLLKKKRDKLLTKI